MTITARMRVNGVLVEVPVDPLYRLSDLLRDTFKLTSVKTGCSEGVCGSCTVLVDGRAARSCLLLAVQCEDTVIETVESLSPPGADPTRAQSLFLKHNAFQCGFCTGGLLMIVEEMRRDHASSRLSLDEIDDRLCAIVCRCTGYRPIRAAVRDILSVST